MAKNIPVFGNMQNTHNTSNSFQSLLPAGIGQFNNFVADPRTSAAIEKTIQNREPNLDSIFMRNNVWGVNSPLNDLGRPSNMQALYDPFNGNSLPNNLENAKMLQEKLEKNNIDNVVGVDV